MRPPLLSCRCSSVCFPKCHFCVDSHLECGSRVSFISSGLTKLSDSSVVPTDGVSRALFRLLPSHELNLGEDIKLVSLNGDDAASCFLSQDLISIWKNLIVERTVFSTLDSHLAPYSVLLLSVRSSTGKTGRSASS